jgi:hypothetical protein
MNELMWENRIGAADLCAGHFVARRSKPHCGGFSFLAPRGQLKSPAAPSAVIHEMPSRPRKTETGCSLMFAYVRVKSLMFAYFEKKYFFPPLWSSGEGTQRVGPSFARKLWRAGRNCAGKSAGCYALFRESSRSFTKVRTDQARNSAIVRIVTGGTLFCRSWRFFTTFVGVVRRCFSRRGGNIAH